MLVLVLSLMTDQTLAVDVTIIACSSERMFWRILLLFLCIFDHLKGIPLHLEEPSILFFVSHNEFLADP